MRTPHTPPADFEVPGARSGKRARVAAELVADMREGRLPTDVVFDRVLSRKLRTVSHTYWTPIEVIARVAEWIERRGIRSVVDVGSGAGKFCVVAALLSRSRFVGVEQRPWLVEAARDLARVMGVDDRVEIIQGTLGSEPLPAAEAYYFFNPFGENLFGVEDSLGADVELGIERHQRDIKAAKVALDSWPLGTYVITYNGFGGRMPPRYGEVEVDREFSNVLRLWRKDVDDAPSLDASPSTRSSTLLSGSHREAARALADEPRMPTPKAEGRGVGTGTAAREVRGPSRESGVAALDRSRGTPVDGGRSE